MMNNSGTDTGPAKQLTHLYSLLNQSCAVFSGFPENGGLFDCLNEDEKHELNRLLGLLVQNTERHMETAGYDEVSDPAWCSPFDCEHNPFPHTVDLNETWPDVLSDSGYCPSVDDLLLYAYGENRIDDFRDLIVSADVETRKSFLKIACNHQKDDFVSLILEHLPDSFNADAMAEHMVKNEQLRSLLYILDYVSEKKQWELFDLACGSGYTDIADCLYDRLSGVKSETLIKRLSNECARVLNGLLADSTSFTNR